MTSGISFSHSTVPTYTFELARWLWTLKRNFSALATSPEYASLLRVCWCGYEALWCERDRTMMRAQFWCQRHRENSTLCSERYKSAEWHRQNPFQRLDNFKCFSNLPHDISIGINVYEAKRIFAHYWCHFNLLRPLWVIIPYRMGAVMWISFVANRTVWKCHRVCKPLASVNTVPRLVANSSCNHRVVITAALLSFFSIR